MYVQKYMLIINLLYFRFLKKKKKYIYQNCRIINIYHIFLTLHFINKCKMFLKNKFNIIT